MHENPAVVDAALAELCTETTGLTRVEKMNRRNELARTLVKTTHAHLAQGLAERAKATHELELKEWGLRLDDISEAEDVQL
jgi:hypothetical protein